MSEINYTLIMVASFFAVASPGPATLAIAGTSMSQGRLKGAILATGITTGSLIWSCSAALGVSAIMYTNEWLFELIRYFGALYILYMAYKSTCSALNNKIIVVKEEKRSTLVSAFYRGVAIHLTNPKAVFFFASLYAIAIPENTKLQEILVLNGLILIQGFIVFQSYAYIFSIPKVRDFYIDMRRWFESFFAVAFGFAGLKILMLKLD